MGIILILALVAVVILIVGYPLVDPLRYQEHGVQSKPGHTDNDVYGKREIVFEALRDLQFEFATGKLSTADYEQLKGHYEVQAAEIMQQIDGLRSNKNNSTRGARPCPRCSSPLREHDKFCTKCGAKV